MGILSPTDKCLESRKWEDFTLVALTPKSMGQMPLCLFPSSPTLAPLL